MGEDSRQSSTAERRALLLVLLVLAVSSLPLWLGVGFPLSTRLAAVGGMLAASGALTVFRPFLRTGGWFSGGINLTILEAAGEHLSMFPPADRKRYEEYSKRLQDPKELMKDASSVRSGVFLIVLGTLLNGFSGFFA